jgi:hypothetical protein
MRYLAATFATVALVLGANSASAGLRTFKATMTAAQETPPVLDSTGTGSCTATLDDVSGFVTVSNCTFTGLHGLSTNAHIHGLAAAGVGPVGVILPLSFDANVTSGNVTGSGVLSGGGQTTAALIAGMIAGQTYVNVHSTTNGGGEIRGQLLPVPTAPAAPFWGVALLGLGLAGAGALLVGRRRGRAV